MAKFSYRMQNILDIKYKMESQAKALYASSRARLNEEQARLEKLFAGKKRLEDSYRKKAQGRLNVRELMDARNAINYQKELIKDQLVKVRVAEKNLEAAKSRLSEVMKERKTHEKLREKAFEGFLEELSAQEKKEIDELVSYKYGAGGSDK